MHLKIDAEDVVIVQEPTLNGTPIGPVSPKLTWENSGDHCILLRLSVRLTNVVWEKLKGPGLTGAVELVNPWAENSRRSFPEIFFATQSSSPVYSVF